MTPAARVQSSIDLLDTILSGVPTEQALTRWARANRFAGSKDRAAIRDHVFAAIRCRRSFAALGGSETGRGLMIGLLRSTDADVSAMFDGSNYGADALSEEEMALTSTLDTLEPEVQADLPDWLWQRFQEDLGDAAAATAECLRHRADVFLRVNLLKSDVDNAIDALAKGEVSAERHALSETALIVTKNARRVSQSEAYRDGFVELQDAASQAVCDFLDLPVKAEVLDYCAGGGGKSLALAAKSGVSMFAHDANPERMKDLPIRAERAGANVTVLENTDINQPFDIVLCDVPCSGSGSWRRSPDGKWRLTPESLDELVETQSTILDTVVDLVRDNGEIAYATCSVLTAENQGQIEGFLSRNPAWKLVDDRQFLPQDGADGFYIARLTRT